MQTRLRFRTQLFGFAVYSSMVFGSVVGTSQKHTVDEQTKCTRKEQYECKMVIGQ